MDVKQLRYILAIAEEKNISKAAEKLFVTQSALNQQLIKLERELGVALFTRSSHSMIPTYAGNIYLEAAQKMLDTRNEAYKILHDISDMKRGEIAIAYTPERGSRMFSAVYPRFHHLYPEITFKIYEARMKRMEQLLEKRTVTIAYLAYTEVRNPLFHYHDFQRELMVLALPLSHPLAHLAGPESWKTLPSMDIGLLKDTYFVLFTHETLMRDMVDRLFEQAGFRPKVLFESTSTNTVVNMVSSQVCAAFFPQSYVNAEAPMAYFSTNPPVSWTLTIASRKDAYLNKVEQEFIRLSQKYQ